VCLSSKILQLRDTFQHKLGWLIGKMYSRVATDDWVPQTCGDERFKEMIAEIANEACVWVDASLRQKLSDAVKLIPEQERTTDRVLAEYKKLKEAKRDKKKLLINRLGELLAEQQIDADVVRQVKNLVASDPEIAPCIAK
jgi:hypothetical protein